MNKIKVIIAVLFIMTALFSLPSTLEAKSKNTCVDSPYLDQFQCYSNAGLSARNTPFMHNWQSFEAGKTGLVSRIYMGFFNHIDGKGTIEVFVGEGTDGLLLAGNQVSVKCDNDFCLAPFDVTFPVVSGQTYTFQFSPQVSMPDPYGVLLSNPGKYSRGTFGITNFGTSTITKYDLVFATLVE